MRFCAGNYPKGWENQMTEIFAAVDLTTVATSVIAIGVAVIGICMAFKGIDLGKRGVKKA